MAYYKHMPQIQLGRLLIAGVIASIVGVGALMSPLGKPTADMHIEPQQGTRSVGETFTVDIVVEASEPVNVFKGDLRFDHEILTVESISYNTSIADLWAEEPWYSNGDGTLNFIGGTTQTNGFVGDGALLSITFSTDAVGKAAIRMREVRILRHDGFGRDALVAKPIDAIFTVESQELERQTVLQKSVSGPDVTVLPKPPTTDLNGDGRQTIADVSIFMGHLVSQNMRSDFNMDGRVNTADMSIILDAQ